MFDRTFQIKGTHATYWKRLCKTTTDKVGPNEGAQFKIFERYIDAYMVAPILGCLYNRKGSKDLPDSEDVAAMQANILINNQKKLLYIYRLIMLTEKSSDLTEEQRIDRAFKTDSDEEIVKSNMQIFHDYFLGGLEILYDVFVNNCITDDDYINKIYEFVDRFKLESIDDDMLVSLDNLLS